MMRRDKDKMRLKAPVIVLLAVVVILSIYRIYTINSDNDQYEIKEVQADSDDIIMIDGMEFTYQGREEPAEGSESGPGIRYTTQETVTYFRIRNTTEEDVDFMKTKYFQFYSRVGRLTNPSLVHFIDNRTVLKAGEEAEIAVENSVVLGDFMKYYSDHKLNDSIEIILSSVLDGKGDMTVYRMTIEQK